jgi:signal peptidase I
MTAKPQNKKKAQPVENQTASQVAWEWIKSGIIGFLIFLVVRTFLIQTFTIVSGSMEGTLLVGDFLVLNKSAYGATVPGTEVKLPGYAVPTRGDIIVFRGHHEPIDLVKRLVGMPGDTLEMRDGVLYRNGQPQDEPYAHHTDPHGDGGHPWMDWQAQYLVDGVNRDESLDSRYWGLIDRPQIKGRAVALYFSYNHRPTGTVPVVSRIRWDRIGERLK